MGRMWLIGHFHPAQSPVLVAEGDGCSVGLPCARRKLESPGQMGPVGWVTDGVSQGVLRGRRGQEGLSGPRDLTCCCPSSRDLSQVYSNQA